MTLHCLDNNNLDYVGGGNDIKEASRTLYPEKVKDVAIINCCEKEFSIASTTQGGSNPLDPVKVYYAIREAKENNCKVIVIVHGGCEHYQYPTPRMVDTYRFFIDSGADAIVNHHQHCYSGVEEYKGKPIFYGLGNFCFDWEGKRKGKWNEGFFVALDFNDTKISYQIYPYYQCDDNPSVSLMRGEDKMVFFKELDGINKIIQDPDALTKVYSQFLAATSEGYKLAMEPYSGRILRKLYSMNLLPSFCKGKKKILLKNLLRCESHYERLLASLE